MTPHQKKITNKLKYVQILVWILMVPTFILTTTWSAAALWIDVSVSRILAILMSCVFVLAAIGNVIYVRPYLRALWIHLAMFLSVVTWWLMIPAQDNRDWLKDVACVPRTTLEGDLLTIYHLRNFEYRSTVDYTERWEKRTYDLGKLRSLDMFLVYWGDPKIAHPIFSWGFDDGRFLAISIETRKEKGETYSTTLGFFRQFELYYVVADERDVIRLRTHHRGEQVFLYRMNAPVAKIRGLLEAYLNQINALAETPQWYNALSHNCTTMVHYHNRSTGGQLSWNWRIILNGYLDEYLHENNLLKGNLPFKELRKKSFINEQAQACKNIAEFSKQIREGLWEDK
ncbi:Lnb N-terminal periplasmic domain-containing protein [Candidatus Uabimicrobium amorphum]|uniref:Membrane protein n=1 Tax=Uabimicrobium amorphum TaxID=2596890 RepID=A0A5S9IRN3_UABAM|nr:DUF4105 domain-containing protein [Candidatus Uabimicrobium amorphum]BBM86356.1 membrane protein [Candidatus Uabimicrobium amorphum]